jgi:WhiB family redox-sensing transcriptional regulator
VLTRTYQLVPDEFHPFLDEVKEHRADWMPKAACKDADPDMFFVEKAEQPIVIEHYCQSCPVRLDCLDYAIVFSELQGVWGGHTEQQIRTVRAKHVRRPLQNFQWVVDVAARHEKLRKSLADKDADFAKVLKRRAKEREREQRSEAKAAAQKSASAA